MAPHFKKYHTVYLRKMPLSCPHDTHSLSLTTTNPTRCWLLSRGNFMFRQALHRRACTHTHTHKCAHTCTHILPLYPFFSLEIWHNIQSADKLHFISLEDLTQTLLGQHMGSSSTLSHSYRPFSTRMKGGASRPWADRSQGPFLRFCHQDPCYSA